MTRQETTLSALELRLIEVGLATEEEVREMRRKATSKESLLVGRTAGAGFKPTPDLNTVDVDGVMRLMSGAGSDVGLALP
jgi:hypothetical protein